jgi:hypothetical protein
VQPEGMFGVVQLDEASHRRGKERYDALDRNHLRLIDGDTAALELHDTLTGSLQVAQPVNSRAVGQRDDDGVVRPVSRHGRHGGLPRPTWWSNAACADRPEKNRTITGLVTYLW